MGIRKKAFCLKYLALTWTTGGRVKVTRWHLLTLWMKWDVKKMLVYFWTWLPFPYFFPPFHFSSVFCFHGSLSQTEVFWDLKNNKQSYTQACCSYIHSWVQHVVSRRDSVIKRVECGAGSSGVPSLHLLLSLSCPVKIFPQTCFPVKWGKWILPSPKNFYGLTY